MKLLFDQNISFRITKKIIDQFPDCKYVSDCGLKDSEDSDIWGYAKTNNFSIVTFDSDFYDISLIMSCVERYLRKHDVIIGIELRMSVFGLWVLALFFYPVRHFVSE